MGVSQERAASDQETDAFGVIGGGGFSVADARAVNDFTVSSSGSSECSPVQSCMTTIIIILLTHRPPPIMEMDIFEETGRSAKRYRMLNQGKAHLRMKVGIIAARTSIINC